MPGAIGLLDTLAAIIGHSVLHRTLDGYCRLVTAEGDTVLVADDGSLVTVFRLEGFRSMPGERELSKAVEDLRLALSAQFAAPGYSLQFWFGHTPQLGAADINRAIDITQAIAADTGLDIQDLLDERRRLLPRRLTGERCFLALWSRPVLLTTQEMKTSSERAVKDAKGAPSMRKAQWPSLAIDALVTRHRSLQEALVREFDIVGIELEPLPVHDALLEIKGVLNPEYLIAGGGWKASLPGDYVRARMPSQPAEFKNADVSNMLWPLLARQLMNEHGEILDQSTVQVGETIFSGFDLTLGPEVVVPFNELIRRILDSNQAISWRMSMQISFRRPRRAVSTASRSTSWKRSAPASTRRSSVMRRRCKNRRRSARWDVSTISSTSIWILPSRFRI
jgi:intracellular multiplication protein IcmB